RHAAQVFIAQVAMRGDTLQCEEQLLAVERLERAIALLHLERGRTNLLVRRETALAHGAHPTPAHAIGGDPGLGHARVPAAIRALHGSSLAGYCRAAKF